jgi:hypothetical protein
MACRRVQHGGPIYATINPAVSLPFPSASSRRCAVYIMDALRSWFSCAQGKRRLSKMTTEETQQLHDICYYFPSLEWRRRRLVLFFYYSSMNTCLHEFSLSSLTVLSVLHTKDCHIQPFCSFPVSSLYYYLYMSMTTSKRNGACLRGATDGCILYIYYSGAGEKNTDRRSCE